ncbi:MAG: baseplate J/gp47 family protein [Burkholderiales bacterium]|nr:baseplate J/gp47 family protein [Anaerolineae bacterium]
MAKKPEFLQLATDDDVLSIRDSLSFIRGKEVLLIWPEEGTVLTRKLDLVLIQREAMRRAIRLALVTHDPQVIKHADELNISTFETIGSSERGRWKRGRSNVFTDRDDRPEDAPEATELMPIASRVRVTESRAMLLRLAAIRVFALMLLLGVLATVAYVALPSATVTLMAAHERVQAEVQLVADPAATAVDVAGGVIPSSALRVEIEETGTVETSGAQDLADIPASGSVVFINQTDSEITIPPGTTVGTSAGTPITFRTTQESVLPAGIGLQIEVPIEALQTSAGIVGNVEAGQINTVLGPLADAVTVRNLNATTGGESRSMPAVSEDDRERLLATVRQQLQARAYTEIRPRLNESQFLIVETIRIADERSDWMTYSAQPGDVAATLSLTMRAVVEADAIDQQLGEQIAFVQLSSQVPRGRLIQLDSITYQCCRVLGVDEAGRISFVMNGEGQVIGQINSGQVQQRLAGRSTSDAMTYLTTELDTAADSTPQITLLPEWLPHMPLLALRINVRVVEAAPEL